MATTNNMPIAPKSVAEGAKTTVYKPQFAACRDVGHQWDYFEWYGSKRTLICANCDCRRWEILDKDFKVSHRKYQYPKGYAWQDTAIPIKRLRQTLKIEARKLARWVGPKHGRLPRKAEVTGK